METKAFLTHSSYQGVCRRYGTEDKHVTRGDLVLSQEKGKSYYKGKTEMDDEAVQGVGEPNSTLTIGKQKQWDCRQDQQANISQKEIYCGKAVHVVKPKQIVN